MDLALLNRWQRGFPLEREPFARIGAEQGLDAATVLARYHACRADGRLGRIGGVFAAGAGGSGLLAAMAVPPARLEAVAAQVSALPGVNHNYEREHDYNLWFVIGGAREAAVRRTLDDLEATTGLATLRLPMRRAYRIDLGFDLEGRTACSPTTTRGEAAAPLPEADWPLAALVERGLPLVARPYDGWAAALGCSVRDVLDTLARWLAEGTLKRFGTIVRHHELGFAANAMAVFDVPDALVDAFGQRLARDSGASLAYRRERADAAFGWPYNLFCMVHGRDRDAVRGVLAGLRARCGLADMPHDVLFSSRRFKQTGPRRFALPGTDLDRECCHAA
jgi:DNA-binding Lrp family transcriptional regulator